MQSILQIFLMHCMRSEPMTLLLASCTTVWASMMLSITFLAGQVTNPASMSNRGFSFMNRFVKLKKKKHLVNNSLWFLCTDSYCRLWMSYHFIHKIKWKNWMNLITKPTMFVKEFLLTEWTNRRGCVVCCSELRKTNVLVKRFNDPLITHTITLSVSTLCCNNIICKKRLYCKGISDQI